MAERVTIMMRAFIPNEIDGNPGYVRPVPGKPGQWMIPGPEKEATEAVGIDISGSCFLTDHRPFGSAFGAEGKVKTLFSLTIDGGAVFLAPADPTLVHVPGKSTKLQCHGGGIPLEKEGEFAVRAIGAPSFAAPKVQVIGQVAIKNPHLPAPWIDYDFDLVYDIQTHDLTYAIDVGNFPAFEAYAFRRSDSPVTVLNIKPKAITAWGLIDAGLHLGTSRYVGSVNLGPEKEVHSACDDFSIMNNPSGPWTYGAAKDGNFRQLVKGESWFNQYEGWRLSAQAYPRVGVNRSGTPYKNLSVGGTTGYILDDRKVELHGRGPEAAVLRFTAPATANYSIDARFEAIERAAWAYPTTIEIKSDSANLWSAKLTALGQSATPSLAARHLSKGEFMDFIVYSDDRGPTVQATIVVSRLS